MENKTLTPGGPFNLALEGLLDASPSFYLCSLLPSRPGAPADQAVPSLDSRSASASPKPLSRPAVSWSDRSALGLCHLPGAALPSPSFLGAAATRPELGVGSGRGALFPAHASLEQL